MPILYNDFIQGFEGIHKAFFVKFLLLCKLLQLKFNIQIVWLKRHFSVFVFLPPPFPARNFPFVHVEIVLSLTIPYETR